MELFVIRHAIAEERSPAKPDARRELTDKGRRKFQRTVAALERAGISFDLVLHSPWTRAVQTAEMLGVLVAGELEETDLLAQSPSDDLLSLVEGERVALVGHEPWMSELIALLLLGDADEADRFIVKKGSVTWLEGDAIPGHARLRAMVSPGLLD